jgi:hypothetical protein
VTIPPFPLRWPEGWKRTQPAFRRRPQFATRLGMARDSLLRELRLLGARQGDVVITSDLPVRLDGMPYASGRPVDPGIAVYWRQPKADGYQDRVMACDRWIEPGGNMRAIALSIETLRGLERWGSSSLVDRAFEGFAALPSVAAIDWRQELGIDPRRPVVSVADARDFYRTRARELHPDAGGDPEAMVRLNQAWEAAQRELAP